MCRNKINDCIILLDHKNGWEITKKIPYLLKIKKIRELTLKKKKKNDKDIKRNELVII